MWPNRHRGTYGDSGDLSPLTFGMYSLTLFQSGSADYAHHTDLSHSIRKYSAGPVHWYKSEGGKGTRILGNGNGMNVYFYSI